MRSRVLIGAVLLIGVLAVGTLAAGDVGVTPSRQTVNMDFLRPTVVAGVFIQGLVVLVHDDELMANGEPCTTIYRFDVAHGQQEKLVSFMCKPTQRDVVNKFTVSCDRLAPTGPEVLTAYQFAGDTEAHGVPGYSR